MFLNYSDFRDGYPRCVLCRIIRFLKYSSTMFDLPVKSYFRTYFLRILDSARFAELVRIPMFNNVRFSPRLSKITEDALFAELGILNKGYLLRKFSVCRISRMTDVQQRCTFAEVAQYIRSFPKVTKDRTSK